MPEVRNLFTGSKMNKDLDERLLPQGEYRDGQNISVSKSEGPDEGVVENILGNSQYSNFGFAANTEIIGYHVDTNKDRIYIFATNFNDSSPDNLSNFPLDSVPHPAGGTIAGANCYIAYIEGPLTGGNAASGVIVQGAFLNFSKTHPMLGVDLIEDLLFFTDNRNQPRKINIETAIANPTYYTNEDHISVAKYAPYDPISFIDPATDLPTAKDTLNEYLPANSACVVNSITSTDVVLQYGTLDIDITNTTTRFLNIDKPELGYFKITQISGNAANGVTFGNIEFEYPIGSGYNATQSMAAANAAAVQYYGSGSTAFSANNILQLEELNPYYESNFQGDENYLKDKFVRFSYRFKYDDNEYSLMAPFSQPLFVPKQYGYFLDSAYAGAATRRDEKNTAESGVLKLMENQITRANLIIDLPPKFNFNVLSGSARAVQSEVANEFKINQVQILLKESTSNAIRVVDEISVEDNFTSSSLRYYAYNYISNKPYKVLPDNVSLRIHDKVPIKAAAQATAGNRIIYGNFIEKHASPENLNYNLGISEKFADGDPNLVNPEKSRVRREYINHTVKQNRSYKVGIVLVDRYGRSSNVILRDESINLGVVGEFGSLYAPYENVESVLNWPGNSLKIQFNDLIPTNKIDGYPGVFSATNPLGYLSYKVVVQQKEQEYYNVFTPGATSGKIIFKGEIGTESHAGVGDLTYNNAASISNIVLYGDNINKVPKELGDVGPTETVYGSETLLYPRVVTKYIANATNYPNVWNPTPAFSESSQVTFKNEFTINSILSFKDLGSWVTNRNVPKNKTVYPHFSTTYVDPLYLDASANPFVAQLETSFLVGFAPGVQQDVNTNQLRSFSKNLNVFETNPVESELDIYWESSTAGTIAELNQYVNNGASGGIGVNIGTPTSPPQPVAFSLEETQVPSGTSWIGGEFQAVDGNNSLMTIGTIELAGVTDGNGTVLNPAPFDLINTTGLRYRLRSNTYFYYGADISTRTFNINLRILANGNNIITKTCLLTNEAPSITPSLAAQANINGFDWYEGEIGNPSSGSAGSETYPYPIFAVPPTSQRGPNALIGEFNTQTTVFNGSAGTSLDNLEVKVEKDGTALDKTFFYFNSVIPQTYIRIVNDQAYLLQNVGQKVLLKVIVKDCNGSTGFAFKYYSTWIEIN
jgi:hypothetical protein